MGLFDVDALKSYVEKRLTNQPKPFVLGAPAADVVEVVRCKDCKFCTETYDNGDCWCSHDEHLQWFKVNHFCGYGERRNYATD